MLCGLRRGVGFQRVVGFRRRLLSTQVEETVESSSLKAIDVGKLSSEEVERFRKEGAVVVRNVFDEDWIEALRTAAEANMADPGPLCDEHAAAAGTGGRFHDDQFLWKRHSAMEEYVMKSGAGALAARAMKSKTSHIFYDQLLVKEPGTVAPTPWHSDHSFWHLSGTQICSLWLALDDVAADVGVAYVQGSHLERKLHAITNFSGGDHSDKNTYEGADMSLDPVPDVDALVERGSLKLLKFDMRPGDVILFDSFVIHGAKGNTNTTNRRRGYATRWCGDDVTFDSRPGTMHQGWAKNGYDANLNHGDALGLAPHIHPDVIPFYQRPKDD
mmetsp:Transcript_5081/g.16649  ORF Transcript_5081/g.16649 Transcript_5081/m.16649 type:complete len:329 (+) Transcript_5081:27-1013(+)